MLQCWLRRFDVSLAKQFCLLTMTAMFAACSGTAPPITVPPGNLVQHVPGAVPPMQVAHYTITEIGALGRTVSTPVNVSAGGEVAGNLEGPNLTGFTWMPGAKIEPLPTFGGPNSYVWNITGNGLTTGSAETNIRDPNGEDFNGFGTHLIVRPAIWANGGVHQLPVISGGNQANALGANTAGQVGGISETGVHDSSCVSPQVLGYKPVIWKNGKIQKVLPTFPGDSIGGVIAINDRGDAVGSTGFCAKGLANVPFNARHSVLWRNGKVIDLGGLGCRVGQEPTDINNQDQIVGLSNRRGCKTYHGYFWDGTLHDLGALPGDCCSLATAISARGVILGQSCYRPSAELRIYGSGRYSKNCRGVIWKDGKIIDFNTLIEPNSPLFVTGLNGFNHGMIVGDSKEKTTGAGRAFLAIPTPSQ